MPKSSTFTIALYLFIAVLWAAPALSHPADTLWTGTYTLPSTTRGRKIERTRDGGYIITGYQSHIDGRISLIRIDATGGTLWVRSYGSPVGWMTEGVDETSDGGFIALGRRLGDEADFMLVRTDPDGDTVWTRAYDWQTRDSPYSVQETSDGGLILVGSTIVSQDPWDIDLRVIRLNSSGDTLWTRLHGGSAEDLGHWVEETSDGGFIAAGYTSSFGAGGLDMWLVKMDSNGDTLWTRTYGGGAEDTGSCCRQTSDGGYVVVGYSVSDVDGVYRLFIVKTDAVGDTLWTGTYGEVAGGGHCIQETSDGGFVTAANKFAGSEVYIYLVRTDSVGDTLWTAMYGEPDILVDGGHVIEAYDGGFTLAGRWDSNVYVIRTVPPDYHMLDGRLDSDVSLVADGDSFRLYADWDGEYLYVATQGVVTTPGLDHFVLVGEDLSTPVGAPWAKAGTVAAKTLFLGNEDAGEYHAWYGQTEHELGSGAASASGYYLEGLVRLDSYLSDPLPPAVYLAMGAYGSADSAALVGQAPLGDGDGNIAAAEYVSLPISSASNTMDGELDFGANLVASTDSLNLYATWDGENLYVATEGVSRTSGLDHFIFVGDAIYAPSPTPWGKTGTVAAKTLYLGNEDSNNWCGWFDEAGSLLGVYAGSASGSVLEGVVRLGYHFGSPLPDGIYVAMGAYESPDAGALSAQVPEGNGDLHLDAAEYVYISFDVSGIQPRHDKPAGTPLVLAAVPNPFRGETRIEFAVRSGEKVQVGIYDLRGRRVRILADGIREGEKHAVSWDGTDADGHKVSPGIYFLRLHDGARVATRKVVLVR